MIEGNIQQQVQELEEKNAMKKDIKGKVNWVVFVWAIGIMTALIGSSGIAILSAQGKVEAANERISSVEGDIKAINVKLDQLREDITWIRNKLEN